MDEFASFHTSTAPERPRRDGVIAVAALIVAMVAVAIVGSAWWRPQPVDQNTLALGATTEVDLRARGAGDTIAGVLDFVAPTVAFLTIPDASRSGSGVVVHAAGFVVTNAHVVEGAERVVVSFDDGSEYEATVYGTDPSTDLAVIKFEPEGPIAVATLGNSDTLQVGEFVLALGAPFGLQATATSGIVSGLHRRGLGIARFEDFIVTDAPINSGNSGGPLVNLRGEIVGINTAIIAGENGGRGPGTFAGVGFAIPVNVMRAVAERLIGDGGLGTNAAQPSEDRGDVGDEPVASAAAGYRTQTVAYAEPLAAINVSDPEPLPAINVAHPAQAATVALVEGRNASGRSPAGTGTGFAIETDAGTFLITNEHVVHGALKVVVFLAQDGGSGYRNGMDGTVMIADTRLDLAMLRIPDAGSLTAWPLGDAHQVAVGTRVRTHAARLQDGRLRVVELPGQVTEVDVELPSVAADAIIVATDIAVERGDSGGPLLNEEGRVVGVIVARDLAPNSAPGKSYAILFRPDVEVATLVLEAMNPGFEIGFERVYSGSGGYALVGTLTPGGLGEQLGLEQLDRILSVGGRLIPSNRAEAQRVFDEFLKAAAGTDLTMEILRRGSTEVETINFVAPNRAP